MKYHQNYNRHWSVSPHNNNKNPVKYLLCVEFTEKSSDAIFFKKLKQKKKTWKNKKMFCLVDYSCSLPYSCLKGNGFIPNLSKVFLNHIETTAENISKSLTGWYHQLMLFPHHCSIESNTNAKYNDLLLSNHLDKMVDANLHVILFTSFSTLFKLSSTELIKKYMQCNYFLCISSYLSCNITFFI